MSTWRLDRKEQKTIQQSVVENPVDKCNPAIDEHSIEDREREKHEKEENKKNKSHTGI